jgi:hypothetical protein
VPDTERRCYTFVYEFEVEILDPELAHAADAPASEPGSPLMMSMLTALRARLDGAVRDENGLRLTESSGLMGPKLEQLRDR